MLSSVQYPLNRFYFKSTSAFRLPVLFRVIGFAIFFCTGDEDEDDFLFIELSYLDVLVSSCFVTLESLTDDSTAG